MRIRLLLTLAVAAAAAALALSVAPSAPEPTVDLAPLATELALLRAAVFEINEGLKRQVERLREQKATLRRRISRLGDLVRKARSDRRRLERLPARILTVLREQLGDPYVWGAAGPGAFDCSGLIRYAFGVASDWRLSLPHYTGSLVELGRDVPLRAVRSLDLVFFGSDYHHVGVMLDRRRYIEAPFTGAAVRVSLLADRSPSAIRRLLESPV